MRVAELLRARRTELGLSQQQLAERAELSIGTIRAIESMRTVEPGFFTVLAMAAAMDLDTRVLIEAANL